MQLVGQRRLQVVFQAAAQDGGLSDRLQCALGAEVGAEVGQTGGRAQFEATRDPVDAVAVGTEGAVQNTAGSPGGDVPGWFRSGSRWNAQWRSSISSELLQSGGTAILSQSSQCCTQFLQPPGFTLQGLSDFFILIPPAIAGLL